MKSGRVSKGKSSSVFDKLGTDLKLHLFTFLAKPDIDGVCKANKSNAQMFNSNRFWQQRSLLDNHHITLSNADAKQIYLNNYAGNHIVKIVDMLHFTLGIDRDGHLHLVDESMLDYNEAMKKLRLIRDFAKDKKVLDIVAADGGAYYVLTTDGLYGFGSNFSGQLGLDKTKHGFDEIRLIQASTPNRKILQVDCGMDFVASRTQDELVLLGKITQRPKNRMTYKGDNILDVKCANRRAFVLKRNNVLMQATDEGLLPMPQFSGKKIKEIQTVGNQAMIWCSDGIYVDGDGSRGKLGITEPHVNFTKLPGFDDKTIYGVYLGLCEIVVHCKEGIYVAGMNNTGRLGVGDTQDRLTPVKLNLNQNDVTNIHLTNNTFFEMNGKWHMAGGFAFANNQDKRKENFTEVRFSPLYNPEPSIRPR